MTGGDLLLPGEDPGSADLLLAGTAAPRSGWLSALSLPDGAPGSADLLLGEAPPPEPGGEDVTVTGGGRITSATLGGITRAGVKAQAAASITGLAVSGQVKYLSLAQRPDTAQACDSGGLADRISGQVTVIWQDAARHQDALCVQWAKAQRLSASACSSFSQALALPEQKAILFQRATGSQAGICSAFQQAALLHTQRQALFEEALQVQAQTCLSYQEAFRDRGPALVASWQEGTKAGRDWCSTEGAGLKLWQASCHRYQDGQPAPPGISWRYARLLLGSLAARPPRGCAGPELALIGPPVGAHLVLLSCILLDDGCGSYLIMNTFSLKTEDGQALDARTFSASIDTDSWCWCWSAEMPATMRALVRPTIDGPVTLIATINGHQVKLLAEGLSQHREFPEAWLTVSGRDHTAWLASPYLQSISREVDIELTAHQILVYEVLTENGNPVGWSTTWEPLDWTIPAFAFSHTGTRIEAACRLAEAAGGFVHGHDTDKALIVKQLYPALPRDWDSLAPDKVLSEAFCQVEQVDWSEKPSYDCVTVTGGEFGGRSDLIKLTGSAATNPAPSVVDDLMTDSVATIQRAQAVLSDTGRQARLTLKMPLLQEIGVIKPGAVIDYETAGKITRGLVRSTRIELEFPEIWQTLEIETREAI